MLLVRRSGLHRNGQRLQLLHKGLHLAQLLGRPALLRLQNANQRTGGTPLLVLACPARWRSLFLARVALPALCAYPRLWVACKQKHWSMQQAQCMRDGALYYLVHTLAEEVAYSTP